MNSEVLFTGNPLDMPAKCRTFTCGVHTGFERAKPGKISTAGWSQSRMPSSTRLAIIVVVIGLVTEASPNKLDVVIGLRSFASRTPKPA